MIGAKQTRGSEKRARNARSSAFQAEVAGHSASALSAKDTQALKRLAKKLSAVRQTLRSDERRILDTLITGRPADEVRGHQIAAAKGKSRSQASEVEGHAMTAAAAAAAASTLAAADVQNAIAVADGRFALKSDLGGF
jgi:hypothetical protein